VNLHYQYYIRMQQAAADRLLLWRYGEANDGKLLLSSTVTQTNSLSY
jgi:hypothetical protein